MDKRLSFLLGTTIFPIIRAIRAPFVRRPAEFSESLALRTPFTESDIDRLYRAIGSWDGVIASAGFAQVYGYAKLDQAYFAMVDRHPADDLARLYEIYGKGIA